MKSTIRDLLQEASSDQLLEIITELCDKYKYLEQDIEFILINAKENQESPVIL